MRTSPRFLHMAVNKLTQAHARVRVQVLTGM